MKRSGFFKSLLTVIAAPSVLKDIDVPPQEIMPVDVAMNGLKMPMQCSSDLLGDLNFITPNYNEGLTAKYGSDSYALVLETLEIKKFTHYEKEKSKDVP
jgi:hypothetical protein